MERQRSVLGGKKDISGLPSNKTSPVDKAAAEEHAADACNSVLDGPECIHGLPEKSKQGQRKQPRQ